MTDVVREALEAAVDFIQREADLRDASAFAETDPYIAEPRALCIKLAAALSALGEKDDGWLPIESAPTLDRVIVAGWQPRNRNIIGYWWYHEDVTDEHGKPMDYPSALLWRPFPAVPSAPPAAIRAGGDDVN